MKQSKANVFSNIRLKMLMLLGLMFGAALSGSQTSYGSAMAASVSGVVVDADSNDPIVGASILIKGTSNGTVSDVDGHFSLNVNQLPVRLVISFIGYATQEINVTSSQPVTVRLKQESMMVDEVIVTGYGTFKKSAYAGSATNVKADKMKDIPAVSFQDMLQGNAPGVQFTQASGQPGSSTSLNIRGMGSSMPATLRCMSLMVCQLRVVISVL